MLNLIGNIFILLGALFAFIAALGVYRFSGLYMKIHAATKAGTLGCGLILIGVALQFRNLHTLTEVILLILFICITNPISGYLLAKTAYQTKMVADMKYGAEPMRNQIKITDGREHAHAHNDVD